MSNTDRLETCTRDLLAAVNTITAHCSSNGFSNGKTDDSPPEPLILPEADGALHQARRSALTNLAEIQSIISGPADFLQQLTIQTQLLACIQWLGEFQVLACIPLQGSVPVKDLALIAGVPEPQLSRIVRMACTARFLRIPQPHHVAHSALSASFVARPSYLDAAMFLGGTVAPAALHMAGATERFGEAEGLSECPFNVAFNTPETIGEICARKSKVLRQWPAFLRYATDDVADISTDILTCLRSPKLSSRATVVEMGARSPERAMALADTHPNMQFIVQPTNCPAPSPSGHPPLSTQISHPLTDRITLQKRLPCTPQTVRNADVYILNLPPLPPTASRASQTASIIAEINEHFEILRQNPSATLVLTPRMLPECGVVDGTLDATARARDLSLWQLANGRELDMAELIGMLNAAGNGTGAGRLVLVDKIRSKRSAAVALEVRYQSFSPL